MYIYVIYLATFLIIGSLLDLNKITVHVWFTIIFLFKYYNEREK